MNNNMKHISLEYFQEGMVLTENVYNNDGNLLLLSKNTTLTKGAIEHLKKFNLGHKNVTVSESFHKSLTSHGIPASFEQLYLESKVGYTETKEKTNELLLDISKGKEIRKEIVQDISKELSDKVKNVDPSLIFQCINGDNAIDEYLYRHSMNVGLINGLMGKWLKLPEPQIDLLVTAGFVHDVGKTKIPDEILNAPRRLTKQEFEVITKHPVYASEMLSRNGQFSAPIIAAARSHHEKMNGSGYPDKLVGNKIPLFARITAVADVYDAMVSKRCYKSANSPFAILSQLAHQQFSELDMSIVSFFTELMPYELVGKSVLMSDGSVGIVKHIMVNDLENPIVQIDNDIIQTSNELYCVSMILDE